MAISLSEQLESDIKAYLHKTFGTYFSSLDERFAADIKDDVISASDFNHGYYNDDDISIAFQRVTLGRMRHPDWQIYHSCTDTEVNTMKQNVKVNTPIHIRPASPEEAGLFYSELEEAADKKLGTVGHVRMDFGSSGKGFHHSWWPHMLSYITLHPEDWQSHSYVACCGTSIQPVLKLLERQPQINTVLLCLDNDEAGHLASRRMEEQLAERYTVERLIPAHKDWNDDLTAEEPSYAQVMQ